jgi:hypothetical protein
LLIVKLPVEVHFQTVSPSGCVPVALASPESFGRVDPKTQKISLVVRIGDIIIT